MNEKLAIYARKTLKDDLRQCSKEQQTFFNRMYSYNGLDSPINEVIDNMPEEKLDHALRQVHTTLERNREAIVNEKKWVLKCEICNNEINKLKEFWDADNTKYNLCDDSDCFNALMLEMKDLSNRERGRY